MPLLAAITLRTADDWHGLVSIVREHAGPMAALGTPLRVMLAKKVARRRDVLNRLMWAGVLDQIAQQVCIGGQWFSAEAFHEYLKAQCLPETCAKGVDKWAYHADDSRSLRMSTGDLDDEEMADYLLAIQAHAAIEWGVVFTDREEA